MHGVTMNISVGLPLLSLSVLFNLLYFAFDGDFNPFRVLLETSLQTVVSGQSDITLYIISNI